MRTSMFKPQHAAGASPHHQTRHSYPSQTRTDIVPHADAPTPDLLTHRQLQEEERDADDDEEDEVWNQVGP